MVQKERSKLRKIHHFQGKNINTNIDIIDYGYVLPKHSHASELKKN